MGTMAREEDALRQAMTKPISPRHMPLALKKGSDTPPSGRPSAGILRAYPQWLTSLAGRIDWARAGALCSILFVAVIWIVLIRLLKDVSWSDVKGGIARASSWHVGLAFVATAASYMSLVAYDALALRQVGARHISLPFTALTSFIAQAFTFTLGFSLVTGSFVRLRLYQTKGLQPSRIL